MERQEESECPPRFLRTIPGMLKIVEMVLIIFTFALSLGNSLGVGWVEWVLIWCFISVTIRLILNLITLWQRSTLGYLVALISYCVNTIILTICGIVKAIEPRASDFVGNGAIAGACSLFAFASAVVCGVDAIIQYQEYQKSRYENPSSSIPTGNTTTTTTTTTTAAPSTAPSTNFLLAF